MSMRKVYVCTQIKVASCSHLNILRIFAPLQVEMYYLTKPIVCGARESRRLGVDCSTGRRPMEWADEPPPPILLYRFGFALVDLFIETPYDKALAAAELTLGPLQVQSGGGAGRRLFV